MGYPPLMKTFVAFMDGRRASEKGAGASGELDAPFFACLLRTIHDATTADKTSLARLALSGALVELHRQPVGQEKPSHQHGQRHQAAQRLAPVVPPLDATHDQIAHLLIALAAGTIQALRQQQRIIGEPGEARLSDLGPILGLPVVRLHRVAQQVIQFQHLAVIAFKGHLALLSLGIRSKLAGHRLPAHALDHSRVDGLNNLPFPLRCAGRRTLQQQLPQRLHGRPSF
jgi:hypothetical protein